jgi:hypothetical protein
LAIKFFAKLATTRAITLKAAIQPDDLPRYTKVAKHEDNVSKPFAEYIHKAAGKPQSQNFPKWHNLDNSLNLFRNAKQPCVRMERRPR